MEINQTVLPDMIKNDNANMNINNRCNLTYFIIYCKILNDKNDKFLNTNDITKYV